jgi:hypothetical protein
MTLLRKSSFPLLMAALILLFLGPVQAEMSCEDMPCCTGESISQVKQSESDCRACNPDSCDCSIQSSTPDYQSETGLFFSFRFEPDSSEDATCLFALAILKPNLSSELESYSSAEGALLPCDEHVSYSAFPNPPPVF